MNTSQVASFAPTYGWAAWTTCSNIYSVSKRTNNNTKTNSTQNKHQNMCVSGYLAPTYMYESTLTLIIHYKNVKMIDKWWYNPIQWHCIFVDLFFKLYFSYKMGWVRFWLLPLFVNLTNEVVAIVDLWLKVPPVTGWSRLGKCVKETGYFFRSFFSNS